jgi:hypothetical protein
VSPGTSREDVNTLVEPRRGDRGGRLAKVSVALSGLTFLESTHPSIPGLTPRAIDGRPLRGLSQRRRNRPASTGPTITFLLVPDFGEGAGCSGDSGNGSAILGSLCYSSHCEGGALARFSTCGVGNMAFSE